MIKVIKKLKSLLEDNTNFLGYFTYLEMWLTFLGVNIFNPKWFWKSDFQMKFSFTIYMTSLVNTVWFSTYGVIHPFEADLEDRLTSVIGALFGSQLLLKKIIFMYNREGFVNIKKLATEDIKTGLSGEDLLYRRIMLKYGKYAQFILQWVTALYLSAGTTMILFPLVFGKDWLYPVNVLIPGLHPKSYPGYAINYVNVSLIIMGVATGYLAFDCYFVIISLYLSSRFELCGENFLSLGRDKDIVATRKHLKFCEELFDKTLRLHAICKNMFELIVFLQISSMVLVIGFEMIIVLINPMNSYYLLSASSITEAFLYCVSGELVAFKAAEVADKIYNSNWYEIDDIPTKKALILIILRCQQTFYFDYKGYEVSMETFARVLSVAFKCFNTVRNFLVFD